MSFWKFRLACRLFILHGLPSGSVYSFIIKKFPNHIILKRLSFRFPEIVKKSIKNIKLIIILNQENQDHTRSYPRALLRAPFAVLFF